jgi:hypothetical protein
MSISTYQNNVNRYQKEISQIRKDLSKEIEKKSNLIKKIADLNASANRTSSSSTAKQKLGELARKQQELANIEKTISVLENKLFNKNKNLVNEQNHLQRAIERENQKKVNKEKQQHHEFKRQQQEKLSVLKSINQELQKKTLLEKELNLSQEDIEDSFFVLKGDIKNYSRFMNDPELSKYIPENFDILVKKNAMDCFYYNVTGGDSLLIIEYDFKKIVKVAKRIIEDTNDLKGNPEIRIAIDFGSIVYSHVEGIVTKIKTGEPLRTSARLEPYVKPNEIWCTENCLKSKLDNSIKYTELHENEVNLTKINGRYNLKKKDSSEPDILMNLYKIT